MSLPPKSRAHLRPCPACARHVRVSEASCPFCGDALPASFRESAAPRGPTTRLTRAALFAFGTGGMALTPACSSSSSGSNPPPIVDAAYGGPPVDGGNEDAGPIALYGGPPMTDAGPGEDASPAEDSGPAATDAASDAPPFIIDAAYGGPPITDGGTD